MKHLILVVAALLFFNTASAGLAEVLFLSYATKRSSSSPQAVNFYCSSLEENSAFVVLMFPQNRSYTVYQRDEAGDKRCTQMRDKEELFADYPDVKKYIETAFSRIDAGDVDVPAGHSVKLLFNANLEDFYDGDLAQSHGISAYFVSPAQAAPEAWAVDLIVDNSKGSMHRTPLNAL